MVIMLLIQFHSFINSFNVYFYVSAGLQKMAWVDFMKFGKELSLHSW